MVRRRICRFGRFSGSDFAEARVKIGESWLVPRVFGMPSSEFLFSISFCILQIIHGLFSFLPANSQAICAGRGWGYRREGVGIWY
jgi:hypothetical protein